MEITDVRVKLVSGEEERLRASCTVTIDDEFVIRDVKVIEGSNGLFVAMPSRKLMDHCPKCRAKNHLRARFCNGCGTRLNEDRATRHNDRSTPLHAEVAHPINSECRDRLQSGVLAAYHEQAEGRSDNRGARREQADAVRQPPHQPSRSDEEPEPRNDPVEAPDNGDEVGGYDALVSELKSEAKVRKQPVEPLSADADDGFSAGIDAERTDRGQIDTSRDDGLDHKTEPAAPAGERRTLKPVEADDDFASGIL